MANGGIPQRSPERMPDELLDKDDDEAAVDEEALLRQTREDDEDRERRRSQKFDDHENRREPSGDEGDDDEEVERKARVLGWKPESEWRGRQGGWVDARTYLERSYRNRGIHKQQTDGLIDTIDELKRQNEELQREVRTSRQRQEESAEVLGQIWKRVQTSERAGYEKALRDLQAARREAIENGEVQEVDRLEKQIANLKPPEHKPAEREEGGEEEGGRPGGGKPLDPAIVDFIDRNEWYRNDAMLNTIAQSIHVARRKEKPNEPLAENLEHVEREVKRRFPEKFENEARRRGGPPTPSERRGRELDGSNSRGQKHTFNDLPPDAKAACERFERTIAGFSREQYVRDYFNS